MPISEAELIQGLESYNGYPFDSQQKSIITHDSGPLWITAGPGTGKTEVLVGRCLKLICCDSVDPRSVFITTFTEKAARNLSDRISDRMEHLQSTNPSLKSIDHTLLRVGTLHSLCNEVMQEYRYVDYQNVRLMDAVESQMFIRLNVAKTIRDRFPSIQTEFPDTIDRANSDLWTWTKGLAKLFGRVTEDQVSISALTGAGGPMKDLADAYTLYRDAMNNRHVCDFGTLLEHFLSFLQSQQGVLFLGGDGTPERQPLLHVLVDEYQDTNPIQEAIYFRLADRHHNLAVVGDDDQALYRFRGGTVECMVGFGERCRREWSLGVTPISLSNNYRSNPQIVEWCNHYITSFSSMSTARTPGKPLLVPRLPVNVSYPAVGYIRANDASSLASTFADTVHDLVAHGVINDYSQCVLLLRSSKYSANNAAKYVDALAARGIAVYNPRSKAFADQTEVKQLLGVFIRLLDRTRIALGLNLGRDLGPLVTKWWDSGAQVIAAHSDLADYVNRSHARMAAAPTDYVIAKAAPTILYRILSMKPFSDYTSDPEADLRMSKITRLLEAYCSIRGRELRMDRTKPGIINEYWLTGLYYALCGYVSSVGIDDDEEEDAICPPGRVPIMTIHQAKGLEFEFVFVGHMGHKAKVSDTHRMEDALRPYRLTPQISLVHPPESRALFDDIRLHFVAYSRARTALIMLGSKSQFKNDPQVTSFGERGGSWFQSTYRRL